ncbi:DotD/TraH family lipoprotein [Pantoea allii]|uniref:DotD/TraH family lipoprotein n=1 Tax=Pantoea allii TaxID=574096 RepID=UPI003D7B0A73
MKMKMKTALAAVSVLVLAGCSSHSNKEKEISAQQLVDQEIREQAITIKLAQDELYQAGAINRTRYKFPTVINANSQYVRVTWQGDAYELLGQLAKQRGLQFTSQGIKLPLPLNIDVGGSKVTFEQLLTLIRQQTQYRATINQKPGELQLLYLTPSNKNTFLRGGRA